MEIYLGSRIEHASERLLLKEIQRIASTIAEDVVVLANVNFGGRQIDLVVCFEARVIVLEAKGYTRPVRGGHNGAWQVRLSSDTWKQTENAYVQALAAKNALRDTMRAFAPSIEPPYPAAAVVFTSELPAQSKVQPGDFKVAIVGMTDLENVLRSAPTNAWPLHQWRAFARNHGLTEVATVEACCDGRFWADERLLTSYSSEFARTYGPTAERLVRSDDETGGKSADASDFAGGIGVGKADILLCGPSGCGKSLLALDAALSAINSGAVAIVFAAQHYETTIKVVLDREVGLLAPCSTLDLLAAARRQQRTILLVVDGYNECQAKRRETLTRGMAALRRRFECSILVTSRIHLERADLLSLRQVDVLPPSTAVKRTIASQAIGGKPLPPHLDSMIKAVTSGLEARLVGEIGQALGPQPSRHELFDAFARRRLGSAASEGIRALAGIAQWLNEHLTFSVSTRVLDRVTSPEQIQSKILTKLIEKGLITSRGGRLCFSHEMFFHAFAAEAVIRSAAGHAGAIIQALRDPRHADRRDLIVGAIDDPVALATILENTQDASLVRSCVSGACGRFPREWIEVRYPQVLTRMREEVDSVSCALDAASTWRVSITTQNPMSREGCAPALVQHLPDLLLEGVYLKETWDVVEALDQRLACERARLRDQAREQGIGLKSSTFAAAYATPGAGSLAIARVCAGLRAGFLRVKSSLVPEIARLSDRENITPGQLYVLGNLCARVEDGPEASALVDLVAGLIERHGPHAPYHVQLAMVDAASHCVFLKNNEPNERLIEALESLLDDRNMGVNTAVLELLQQLGTFELEEENLQPQIRETIAQLVCEPDASERWKEADRIYNLQFDGPYSNAYWEVVNGLPHNERKTLLEMAAKGAEYADLFLSVLLLDLAAFNDPGTEAVFHRWAALPPRDSFMPQQAIEVFVLAHVALARLGAELHPHDGNNAAETALLTCGRLLYWANHLGVAPDIKARALQDLWTTLNSEGVHHHALNVISACSHLMIRSTDKLPGGAKARMAIADVYPGETTAICRRALEQPETLAGYFEYYHEHDRIEDQTFALHALSKHGSRTDLPLLRKLAQSRQLGRNAINGIRSIEERFNHSGPSSLQGT